MVLLLYRFRHAPFACDWFLKSKLQAILISTKEVFIRRQIPCLGSQPSESAFKATKLRKVTRHFQRQNLNASQQKHTKTSCLSSNTNSSNKQEVYIKLLSQVHDRSAHCSCSVCHQIPVMPINRCVPCRLMFSAIFTNTWSTSLGLPPIPSKPGPDQLMRETMQS